MIIKYRKSIWFAGLGIAAVILLLQSYSSPLFVWRESNYLAQPYDTRGVAKMGVYLMSYLATGISIMMAILSRSKVMATIALGWLSITYAVDLFVQYMGSYRGFSTEELTIAISQVHLITNMKSYLFEIIVCGLVGFVIAGLGYWLRKNVVYRFHPFLGLAMLLISTLAVHFSAKKVYSILLNAYPAPIKTLAIGYNYLEKNSAVENRLLPQTFVPTQQGVDKNIIWIIDESVTGSFMSINGYEKSTTPFLANTISTNPNLKNYGPVNSISNCSNYSNLFLRTGLTPSRDYTTLNTLPSILSYAHNAGYKVVMLDSQITPGEMANFLTPEEMGLIDDLQTLDRSVVPMARDIAMNKKLTSIIAANTAQKLFIIYIKFGCHWPYLLNFDNQDAQFIPIQPSTFTRMIPENKELVINTYLNSIYHNVDRFWEDLIAKVDATKNMVIYTSDHGQSILESDTPRTHCSNNVEQIPYNEFNVPLILYSSNLDSITSPRSYSQIQIFPTTLQMMGYDSMIYNQYGPTLSTPILQRQSWVTGTGVLIDFEE